MMNALDPLQFSKSSPHLYGTQKGKKKSIWEEGDAVVSEEDVEYGESSQSRRYTAIHRAALKGF
jgi:hypothetical protein